MNPYTTIQTTSVSFSRVKKSAQEDSATQPPATMASSSSATPMTETSVTRPGRRTRRYTPMKRAIGMVMPMEKTPQGECASAPTMTSASTASRMIMMTNTARRAAAPPTGPISSRAIWPSERPSRRVEKNSVTMSWTAPAEDDARDDPDGARQVAHLRGEHRADQRARAG